MIFGNHPNHRTDSYDSCIEPNNFIEQAQIIIWSRGLFKETIIDKKQIFATVLKTKETPENEGVIISRYIESFDKEENRSQFFFHNIFFFAFV